MAHQSLRGRFLNQLFSQNYLFFADFLDCDRLAAVFDFDDLEVLLALALHSSSYILPSLQTAKQKQGRE
jgi:hypothetical protein